MHDPSWNQLWSAQVERWMDWWLSSTHCWWASVVAKSTVCIIVSICLTVLILRIIALRRLSRYNWNWESISGLGRSPLALHRKDTRSHGQAVVHEDLSFWFEKVLNLVLTIPTRWVLVFGCTKLKRHVEYIFTSIQRVDYPVTALLSDGICSSITGNQSICLIRGHKEGRR